MTPREWEQCSYLLENCWRGDFDEDRAAAYYTFLRSYEAAEVEAALHMLVLDAKPFVPAVSEIVAAIRRATEEPVPSWSQVWTAIQRAITIGSRQLSGGVAAKEAAAVTWLEEHVHPVVARFFEVETYARLSQTPFFDDEFGELRIRDLRQRWEGFIEVAEARLTRGLALSAASGNGQLGPRRLDQAALLHTARPVAGELGAG